jgi:AcrR family transcriptional regulator
VTTDPARRGPRADVDAKTLIIDTAERMFGDAAIDAVSLRAVAREAGLGNRAVPYHFPTKADLVTAVLRRRSAPLARTFTDSLSQLVRRETAPTVRDIVEAILMPFVELFREDPRGMLRWTKVYSQLALTEDQIWASDLGTDPSITDLFLGAAGRALPDINDEKFLRRVGIAMYSMISILAGTDLPAYGQPLGPDGLDPDWVEQLVIFITAGLQGHVKP